ncbi:transglycosylase domain-containing protein [Herbidospora mongoliensis]|uniref:transglycosylase domain-containing protein n=1 Tax=Herbidospora mongoliensis TaxID=688067 RepID=UPI000AAF72FF|nr:transglycosylase domain-containing protein [Herbidospora mongoliensis]
MGIGRKIAGLWPRRRFLRIALIGFGVVAVAMIGGFAVVWILTPIPDTTQEGATAQGSVIYYRDGKTVLANRGVDRKAVPLSAVPKEVREAVIAAENRTFYQDQGVSLSGTARAMWSTLTGSQIQGGSTITQQLVRNYYSGLSQERSIGRKLKEIMISLKVDRSKSKDWVLEQYLNTIYFGRGAHGIQAAAQAYFRVDVGKLTPAQGAYLAAVIQQPSNFATPTGPMLTAAQARWKSVVDGMVKINAVTAGQAAQMTFPELKKQKKALSLSGQNGYMLAQVSNELNRMGYSDEDIFQDGLKVTTTFDKKLMAAASDAVTDVLPEGTPKKVRAGLAAVDPANGEVVAFYGGRNWSESEWNSAFDAKVQAGSTFKAYALAAALQDGLPLTDRFYGNSPLYVNGAAIPNSSGSSYGSVNLVQATQYSVNTAFVDLGQKIGLDKIAAAAEAAGIPAAQLAQHKKAATFPLGVASVSAVQQAGAYATFASGGVHQDPHVIRSVTDATGKTRKTDTTGRRVFTEDTAADATYAMEQVVTAGTGTGARLYDRPVAGKTGTTDASAAVWFNGYTPQLSVAVDMFRDDNLPVTIPGYGELYGGALPAQIWKAFMTTAMEGKPVKEFPDPVTYYRWDNDYYRPTDDEERTYEPDRPSPGPTPTGPGDEWNSPPPSDDDGGPSDPTPPPSDGGGPNDEPPVTEQPDQQPPDEPADNGGPPDIPVGTR